MKHARAMIGAAAILALLYAAAPLQALAAETETVKYFTLDNGLQVLLQKRDRLPLVNIVCAVDVGSKDERADTSGLVHLLEHLVLLGSTETHTGDDIIRETRRKGFYLNAHTDHDLMTLELSLPARHLEFALGLVKEKTFALKPAARELEREKKIIIEEINQILDDPLRAGTALALQHLFSGHVYEKPIFGDPAVIRSASISQLQRFYREYFVPGNCALSLVGNFDLAAAQETVRRLFAALKKAPLPEKNFKPAQSPKKGAAVTREMDIQQAHLVIAFFAPHFNHEDYFAVNLLAYILGRGINPLLGRALRGRRELADRVAARYISLKYGGAFLVYLTGGAKKIRAAGSETLKFLNRASSFRYGKNDFMQKDQPFVFDYLESAANQLRLESQEAGEKGLHSAAANARYLLLRDREKEMDLAAAVEEIGPGRIRDAASTYISGEKHVTVSLLPQKTSKKGKK